MCFNTTVEAPAPRNLAQETNDTLATQIALAPQQADAYARTAPIYAQTDLGVLGQTLFGGDYSGTLSDINRRLTDEAALQSRTANTTQREADIADVARLGGTVTGLQRSANPELFGNLAALDRAAAGGVQPGAAENAFSRSAMTPSAFYSPTAVSNAMTTPDSPTALETELEKQARADLALGGNLSDDEARRVRVQSRAAADARGRGFSNAALADEVLNTSMARDSRLAQRRGFATDVNNVLRSGQAADRNYALARDQFRVGVDTFNVGQNLSAAQFNAGRTDADRAAMQSAAGMEASRRGEEFSRQLAATQARLSTFSDPFAGVLGRASTNAGSNAGIFGMNSSAVQPGMSTTRSMFDPFNPYAQDLYNTNYNGAAAANIASANGRASMFGGLLQAGGQLGSAAILGCWVARAAYGEHSPRWRQFRAWLYSRSKPELFAWYIARGPRAARTVRRDSALRARVKAFMDARISELNLQPA